MKTFRYRGNTVAELLQNGEINIVIDDRGNANRARLRGYVGKIDARLRAVLLIQAADWPDNVENVELN